MKYILFKTQHELLHYSDSKTEVPEEYGGYKIEVKGKPTELWVGGNKIGPILNDLRIVLIKFKKNDTTKIAIPQRVSDFNGFFNFTESDFDKDIYRITWLSKEGVESEEFTLSERKNPLYRAKVIGGITPVAVGFVVNISQSYPSFIVPLTYPYLTLIISILGLIILYVKRKSP